MVDQDYYNDLEPEPMVDIKHWKVSRVGDILIHNIGKGEVMSLDDKYVIVMLIRKFLKKNTYQFF